MKRKKPAMKIPATYPMKPDNPLAQLTDEEVRAYIKIKREEWEAKHKPRT